MKIIGETIRCVSCLKEAIEYSGHVKRRDGIVLAGWCKNHRPFYNYHHRKVVDILYKIVLVEKHKMNEREGYIARWDIRQGIKFH